MGKDNIFLIMFLVLLSVLKKSLTNDSLINENKNLVEFVKILNIKEGFFRNVKLNYQL
ncbi:hypothetical protein A0H76_2986 [Hepatospora eriocheir]|uniref:Uncharacterized protein n=1 Tax=Hepatospora eriocheir TaxID=1081669 RepID=A0A1X0QIN8_9MICR|nr:hypothetical protein A0H76_2986 [Hepatospora eriocheir]